MKKLIYFYDALCGWCYGFSPAIREVSAEFEHWSIEVVSGGMVTGERIGPVGNMAEYILNAIPRVEEMAGVEFGESYIEMMKEGSTVASSIFPSKALSAYKLLEGKNSLAVSSEIQKLWFEKGLDLSEKSNYEEIIRNSDVNYNAWADTVGSKHAEKAMEEDFMKSQQFGIQGFPSIVAQKGDKYYLVARGFLPAENLREVLQKIEEEEV
jgi:putative protein-disulfide isomerase